MPSEQMSDPNFQGTAILKELSEIKSNLAVNSSEVGNIKTSIAEIRSDIREIKNDFVNRREHNELLKIVADNTKKLETLEYFNAKIIGMASGVSLIIYYLFSLIGK